MPNWFKVSAIKNNNIIKEIIVLEDIGLNAINTIKELFPELKDDDEYVFKVKVVYDGHE